MDNALTVSTSRNFCKERGLSPTGSNMLRMVRGIRKARIRASFGGPCWVQSTSQGPCDCGALYSAQTEVQGRAVGYCTKHAARVAWVNGRSALKSL